MAQAAQRVLGVHALSVEAGHEGETSTIVDDVSFEVNQGEVVALIGETGSGKTTVGLAALGYARSGCRIVGGRVTLNGTEVLTLSREELRALRGRRVAYVAQSAAATFNPALTIGEQVTESSIQHGVMREGEATARALDLYRRLDLPEPERVGRRYPHQVSGGQLQRLMIAMALCGHPELLVLDEPTTALDVTTQIEVLKALKEVIRDQTAAAIYISHDLAVVAQVADRIVVLRDGKVMEVGETQAMIERPQHDYTRALMAAVRPTPGTRAAEEAAVTSTSTGRAGALVEVNGLYAGYGRLIGERKPRVLVLRDVALALRRGETMGVIGESGCGKSTLARAMAGLTPAVRGEVRLAGRPLARRVEQRQRNEIRRMQIVFQMPDTALNPRQRVSEILGRPLTFYQSLQGRARRRRVAELLRQVGLPEEFSERYPEELSGGQKQRVALARALAAEPDVILCDEVTSALDTLVGAAVIKLLIEFRERLGLSLVFISHDLSTVASFADQIIVMYAGLVVEHGSTKRVLSPPFHPYTRLLVTSVPQLRRGWLEEAIATREAASATAGQVELTDIGCPFFKRCPLAMSGTCDVETPPLRTPSDGHTIACHRTIEDLT